MIPNGLPNWCNDRKGNSNGALCFGGSYCTVPSGVYFNSAFTITVWVKPRNLGFGSRIVDIGNGAYNENIVLSLSDGSSSLPCLQLFVGGSYLIGLKSTQRLDQNSWSFLAASYDGSNAYMYINGNQVGTARAAQNLGSNVPRNVQRNNDYIGKSNFPDGYSQSAISDLVFYNQALTGAQLGSVQNYGRKFFK